MKSSKISPSASKGEVISTIGSSGSGKSTFLRSINLLESPSGGEILYHGDNVLEKVTTSLPIVKDSVWFSNLSTSLKTFNVLENAIVAQTTVLKRDRKEAESIAKANLEKVGMGNNTGKLNQNNSQGDKNNVWPLPVPSLLIQKPSS